MSHIINHQLRCDGPGSTEGEGCVMVSSGGIDQNSAIRNAKKSNWLSKDDKHYCPKCRKIIESKKPEIPLIEVLGAMALQGEFMSIRTIAGWMKRLDPQEMSAICVMVDKLVSEGLVDVRSAEEGQTRRFKINQKGMEYAIQLDGKYPLECRIAHYYNTQAQPVPEAFQAEDGGWRVIIDNMLDFVKKHGSIQLYAPGQRLPHNWFIWVTDRTNRFVQR